HETQSIYTIASHQNLVPIRSRHAYLKRRTQVPNLTMIILFLVLASSVVLALVFSILYVTYRPPKICETEGCVRFAASLKQSMDTSVDPCDDFYNYVCGKWSDEHPIPDKSFMNSWFDERRERVFIKIREVLKDNTTNTDAPWAVKQAKILYTSCMDVHTMNELGLAPVFELLEELGLPPIPAAFTKKTGNYIEQMAMVKKILGRDLFFGLDITPDPRNTSKNVIVLDTPLTSNPLPNDKELEKRLHLIRSRFRKLEEEEVEDSEPEAKDAEITYMTDVIKEILNNGSLDVCSLENSLYPEKEELEEVVETLYEMTSLFYYLSRFEGNETIWDRDPSNDDYMLVDDLQKLTDEYVTEINSTLTPKPLWRPFIESLYKDIDTLDLNDKDKVLIGDLEFLKEAALVLALSEEQELETYIWWVIIDIVVPHTPSNLREIWVKYINEITSIEIGESKSLRCASAVNELMGMAASWLIVDPSFHEDKGKKVFEMMNDIKEAFASMVSHTDWMDAQTKAATLDKNSKMESQIGFPDWLFDQTILNEYYEGIDLSETEYLSNMIQIIRLMSLSELECIHQINYNNMSL
ncbi:neprilysin-11-like, partial [Ceratina calcarata]|uniref:Neprilysin-11-like n=1 Tax=Ceratina calcarata TaxID=156304 RepID=A0AAJ7S7T8_9HYME